MGSWIVGMPSLELVVHLQENELLVVVALVQQDTVSNFG